MGCPDKKKRCKKKTIIVYHPKEKKKKRRLRVIKKIVCKKCPPPKGRQLLRGLAGAIAEAGPQGLAGALGPEGLAGLAGAIGALGPEGLAGALGPEGLAGLAGAIGALGPGGLAGALGPEGLAGLAGAIGADGLAGPAGPAGPAGIQGEAGPAGTQGEAGPAGIQGEQGPAGPAGPQGSQGEQGPSGVGSSLFSAQANDTISLLPVNTVVSLELPPLSTVEGESIKLDSTFRLFFITSNSTAHTLDVSYILRRLGTLPTLLTSAPINRVRQFSTATTTSDTYFPNITWLDSPPPGIHNYRIEIMATASVNITTLQVTNRALNAVAQITSDPFNIYVRAGSFGGNGSLEAPFGTIEEGITAVAQGGTVYVLEGIYNIATQLIISKSLSLNGTLAASTPQIVFDPSTNLNGLVIQADQVMIDSLHIISNRAVTGDNAVFRVPLRTLAQLYNNITIRNSIIEGTTRSGYIWAENMTLDNNEFIHNAVNTQGLRFQMVRGTTNILNNTFRGGSTSIGAIVFEPNIASYTVSGIINVTGNTMTRFTQFVNFFCIIEGPTSLIIQNNSVDHEDRSGSSIILFARVNYALMNNILIQNNSIVNIFPTRLAVYFAGGGTFIPSANQIKVYTNTFNFPNGYGSPTDTVDPVFPVGYSNASPPGMSLGAFDLQGNVNV